ncbi:hypothetical protein [Mesorhizobium tianshanense]|uniref:Uncharacterized protein n=1 Tax=Mesorhizobium tianshanense TaxID=39844 RepID=A0A562N740_9HYPH|nr:hypothetical protein [Mesorhizobium tianshanense]TWI27967.1 hypothetical protein IQ26_05442 [Mesorhizobium tianshanense]
MLANSTRKRTSSGDLLTALSISDRKPFTQFFAACLKVRQTLRPIEAFMTLVRDH